MKLAASGQQPLMHRKTASCIEPRRSVSFATWYAAFQIDQTCFWLKAPETFATSDTCFWPRAPTGFALRHQMQLDSYRLQQLPFHNTSCKMCIACNLLLTKSSHQCAIWHQLYLFRELLLAPYQEHGRASRHQLQLMNRLQRFRYEITKGLFDTSSSLCNRLILPHTENKIGLYNTSCMFAPYVTCF